MKRPCKASTCLTSTIRVTWPNQLSTTFAVLRTVSDFLQKNQIEHIDFLKVDCEGSEVFIFREENTAFFRTQVHKIALEFHNDQKDEIITFLREAGYDVHVEHGEHHLGMLYAKNIHFTKGMVASSPEKAQ